MKKLITVSAMLMACVSMYAQGLLTFANNASTLLTNSLTGAAVPAGTSFRLALYFAPEQADMPADAAFVQAGAAITSIAPVAGRYNGGTRVLEGAPAGSRPWIWVKAWEAVAGTSFEQATAQVIDVGGRAQLAGTSAKFQMVQVLGNGSTIPTPNIYPPAGGLNGIILYPVPEPSVIGLGVLGLGMLMLLRRRK